MTRGSCLCGAVRFEVTGALSEIELCHCRKCRKAYGSAFAATLYAHARGFRWLAGDSLVARFDAPLESDPPAYRHSFCRRCGSPLPLLWEGFPWVELPAACLDDPVDGRPRYHMFTDQKAQWFEIADRLERFERASPLDAKVIQSLL
jgi:hypothetical protein